MKTKGAQRGDRLSRVVGVMLRQRGDKRDISKMGEPALRELLAELRGAAQPAPLLGSRPLVEARDKLGPRLGESKSLPVVRTFGGESLPAERTTLGRTVDGPRAPVQVLRPLRVLSSVSLGETRSVPGLVVRTA